jgi:hypothetical protein
MQTPKKSKIHVPEDINWPNFLLSAWEASVLQQDDSVMLSSPSEAFTAAL